MRVEASQSVRINVLLANFLRKILNGQCHDRSLKLFSAVLEHLTLHHHVGSVEFL